MQLAKTVNLTIAALVRARSKTKIESKRQQNNKAHNLPVCSHGMQELHVSLLAAVPNPGWMEVHSFPIDKYTVAGAVEAVNGYATAPDTPGTGVVFDWVALGKIYVLLGGFE